MFLIETQCCPPVSFFQMIADDTICCIEKHENYQKRSYRNRFYLAGVQGEFYLSIPLIKGKNKQQLITEVKISYDDNWILHYEKVFRTNYSSAPYYDFYVDGLMAIFQRKFEYLFDLNQQLLEWLLQQIGFSHVQIQYTSEYNKSVSYPDHRNQLRPQKRKLSSQQKIRYVQVYEEKNNFITDLSILDMLFCCGPETYTLLKQG